MYVPDKKQKQNVKYIRIKKRKGFKIIKSF